MLKKCTYRKITEFNNEIAMHTELSDILHGMKNLADCNHSEHVWFLIYNFSENWKCNSCALDEAYALLNAMQEDRPYHYLHINN